MKDWGASATCCPSMHVVTRKPFVSFPGFCFDVFTTLCINDYDDDILYWRWSPLDLTKRLDVAWLVDRVARRAFRPSASRNVAHRKSQHSGKSCIPCFVKRLKRNLLGWLSNAHTHCILSRWIVYYIIGSLIRVIKLFFFYPLTVCFGL